MAHFLTGMQKYQWKGSDCESDTDSPPDRDEYDSSDKENYESNVHDKNDSIMRKYSILVSSIFTSLTKKKISVKSAVFFFKQTLQLSEQENKILEKAKTLYNVHDAVKEHLVFVNIEVCEDLIEQYELHDMEQKLQEYIEAFDKCIFTLYKNRVRDKDKNIIVLKLVLNHKRLNGTLLKRVKKRIVTLLNKKTGRSHGIRESMLELKNIAEGCIELKFLVPALVCERILQLSDKARLKLFRKSITCIDVLRSDKVCVAHSLL